MRRKLAALALALSGCAAPAEDRPPAAIPVRFAALPFDNLSPDPGAAAAVANELRLALAAAGAVFVPGPEIDDVLRAHRIRYTDSLSPQGAAAIAERTHARYVLAGTLLAYRPGPDPHVAVAVRLLDAGSGHCLRVASSSLRGSDFVGLLGLGAITEPSELVDEVVVRIVAGLHLDGSLGLEGDETDRLSDASISAGVLVQFRSEAFVPGGIERIAILPLINRTDRPEATDVFTQAVAGQWFRAAGVEVVERAELLAAMRREKVRAIAGMDLATLARLGKDLGTRYFVLGSVEEYREEVPVGRERLPEIEASLRIIDAEAQEIVAAVSIHRRGDDYHLILGLGTVRDPIVLAQRVAREMIAAVGV